MALAKAGAEILFSLYWINIQLEISHRSTANERFEPGGDYWQTRRFVFHSIFFSAFWLSLGFHLFHHWRRHCQHVRGFSSVHSCCQSIRFRYRFWWCGENLICIWHRCVRSVYCVLSLTRGTACRVMGACWMDGWILSVACVLESHPRSHGMWVPTSAGREQGCPVGIGKLQCKGGCWNCQWVFLLLSQNTWQDFIGFDCALRPKGICKII